MEFVKSTIEHNMQLLRSRISRHTLIGLFISLLFIFIAMLLAAYRQDGQVTLQGMLHTQINNPVIWMLDLTPFLFLLWGVYMKSAIAHEANNMIVEQRNNLSLQHSALNSQVMHKAMHDLLTELPNRVLFVDRLSQALTSARNKKKHIAIFIADINNFKEINETIGRHNGDRIIKQIASRLNQVAEDHCTIARLGSNEFGIIAPFIDDQKEGLDFAQKILKVFQTAFSLEGIALEIRAALGVSFYPQHGTDSDTLIQYASIAMHNSKKN